MYNLPPELIAQSPLADRAASRLMAVDRSSGGVRHLAFRDVPSLLAPGDCLVLNETKVIPARLVGAREGTGGAVELLLLRRISRDAWEALARPGRYARPGMRAVFGGGRLTSEIVSVGESGARIVRFEYAGVFEEILAELGEMPLPPYIKEKLADSSRYQTVYAKNDGSAAAPTAGLHFTPELLAEIAASGVTIAKVTLHVGLGTFRPVKVSDPAAHKMHEERFFIGEAAARAINSARASGGRAAACGTTVVRALESAAGADGVIRAADGSTDIFIRPGYQFKAVDAMITNFHLPGSTLIMLVSAFLGREQTLATYAEAAAKRYRFFSFGDAMFIG
jgi:S-adenosylmethionine:tRNA ribosyltransferase-isomerase